VAYVDHYVGRLLTRVRELELWDRSLIVLLSDHGHPLADHGKFLKGADRLYSELLRVPFMIRFPGAEHGGQRVRALAQFHDVLPTLLDALRIPYDQEAFHGRSLLPLIRSEGPSLRESIITGYYGAHDRCIRTETWSLILRPHDQPDELYHLVDDSTEGHNRIDEHPDVAQELTRRFANFYMRGRQPAVKGVQGRYEVAGTSLS
jgi:arylsulfatase A-like enzyme